MAARLVESRAPSADELCLHHPSKELLAMTTNARTSVRKSLAKNRRGVEMAEVAVTLVGIAIAGAAAVRALGSKIRTVNDNTSNVM